MIKTSEYIDVNGKKQYLSIRSRVSGLPLLLYLHAGPGDAALPLVNKYNSALESSFTVVVWEQRGAGKSYYPFSINVVKYKGSLYGKTNYNKLIKDFIFLPDYSLKDLLNRGKGSL